ncbi:unnamed protein product, partial [Gulo gulo]
KKKKRRRRKNRSALRILCAVVRGPRLRRRTGCLDAGPTTPAPFPEAFSSRSANARSCRQLDSQVLVAPVPCCTSLGPWLLAASGAWPVPPESGSLSRHAHWRGDWGWASCLSFDSVSRWPGSGAVGALGGGRGSGGSGSAGRGPGLRGAIRTGRFFPVPCL